MLNKIIGSLLLAATALAPVSSIAGPVEIKFSHVVAENTPKGLMAEKFKELVEERLPGKVKVSVYPNSQLFNDNKVLEAMLLGDVQMAAPSLSKFQSFTKKLQVFDLPFLFRDIDAVDRFQQSETGQELLGSLKKRGLVGLGYLHNGMKQLSSNEAIVTPEQISGKKFRIMTSDVLQAQFEQVDAIPLKKPFSEVFTLLQTRAIDGQENTWSNTYSKKFYEVQPYITASNHGVLDYMVVTSAEFWMTLPDDLRTEIKRAMDDAIAYGNDISKKKADEDRKLIADSGVTQIIDLTDAQRQAWVDAMKPVWKKFERQIGKDVIQAAAKASE
ncbi:TRAP transporter substrate-binding protein [Alteromonas sp. 1_MG-2023]|uniref:TRAP transporter substrate-binding protein n=1 Tax=Alteromonas sp. 1_MG-2023 TaxID=3062669 RepID=UPI0026E379C9|nr:TRAP transporter substrate-binding protein [Alteromonas sp. 1_MG-2023]MDO6474097.1 TRAP transporter substrate-binding protein [Alteromonas sp. 1_MG-2023]